MTDETKIKYIAFSYEDFMKDVEHQPNCVIGAYIRLLHAYTERMCKGLPNREAHLRQLSGCIDDEEWIIVRNEMFGDPDDKENSQNCARYFRLEDGLFHQKRAREEWTKAKDKISKFRERAVHAAKSRYA